MFNHIKTSLFNAYEMYSKSIENENVLCNNNWIMFSNDNATKVSFIFLKNNKLLLSANGDVVDDDATWKLLNEHTIQVKSIFGNNLYRKTFLDAYFLVFEKDNSDEKIVLMNETNNEIKQIHSFGHIIELLHKIYVQPKLDLEKYEKIKMYSKKWKKAYYFNLIRTFTLIIFDLFFGLLCLSSILLFFNVNRDKELDLYNLLFSFFSLFVFVSLILVTKSLNFERKKIKADAANDGINL